MGNNFLSFTETLSGVAVSPGEEAREFGGNRLRYGTNKNLADFARGWVLALTRNASRLSSCPETSRLGGTALEEDLE